MKVQRFSGGVLVFSATLFLTGVSTYGQNPGSMQQPPMAQQQSPNATSQSNAGTLNPQALDDQDFLRKALQGGQAEIELGTLAQQKSQSDDVKQFGEKMVQDHTQLGNQVVMPVAKQLGVKAPKGLSKKDKQLMASLEALSGPQFDQVYIKAMVKDHEQDLKDFKSEEEMSQNPEVKRAAEEGANVISQHLQLIQQIAQKHDIETASK